jgi:hypothetical protein
MAIFDNSGAQPVGSATSELVANVGDRLDCWLQVLSNEGG